MDEWAQVKAGVVRNIVVAADATLAALGGPWDAVVDITAMAPKPGIGWTYSGGTFTPPTPGPAYVYPALGALGVFVEAYEPAGYRWYYVVGPVAFAAADYTPASTGQPTIAQAKAYIGPTATDSQFHQALTWSLDYKQRLTDSITSSGGNPATNQRVIKLTNIVNALGAVV